MIRFYNNLLMSMQNGCTITDDEVWTDGDRIVYVGGRKEHTPVFDKEYDLKDCLVMPGFKNAHTHSAMTFLRSFADDMPLDEWLNGRVFPMEAKLTADDVYTFTQLAILEYLSSGITSAFDMYIFPAEVNSRAAVDMGFRMTHCGSVNNFVGSIEQTESDFLSQNGSNALINYRLGFHAEYTTSPEIMQRLSVLSHKYNTSVSTHCSETREEVENCIKRYGKTPVAVFEDMGLLDNGGTLFHGVWLTDDDMQIIKRHNVTVVANPCSNSKLASGISDTSKMLDLGINVAIGTDGPASNNALDMFREMYLLSVLQKLKHNDAAAMSAENVLKMACCNGAYAMCTDNDRIAEGKLADIVAIDLNQPNMQPLNSIAKNIVYSGSKTNVKLTMVGGKVLYNDGKFAADTKNIYNKANNLMKKFRDV